MPIPKPNDNENRDDFIKRCMADDAMQEYDNEQRLAICSQSWRDRNKEGMMEAERKSIELKLDGDKPGDFTARIAKFNVVDADGDLTLPGAFPVGKKILISAYQHGSWMGELPVGIAIMKEDKEFAIAEGSFNLQSESGKEHYETIKFTGDLQEWSYGFNVLKMGSDDELDAWAEAHDGARPNRILKAVDPFEISPVLKGAGLETATVAIKAENKGAISYQAAHPGGTPKAPEDSDWDAAKEVRNADVEDLKVMVAYVDSEGDPDNKTSYKLPHHQAAGDHNVVWKGVSAAMAALLGARGGVNVPASAKKGIYNHLKKHYKEFDKEAPEFRSADDGQTYIDEAEMALATVEDFIDRTKSLADLRRKEGRVLSSSNRDRIKKLLKLLTDVAGDLKELLDSTEPIDKAAVEKAVTEFAKLQFELMEVS